MIMVRCKSPGESVPRARMMNRRTGTGLDCRAADDFLTVPLHNTFKVHACVDRAIGKLHSF